MVEQGIGDPNSIRKTTVVEAEQSIAWKVFTEKMGAWWPLAYYKIGKANAVDAIIEPRVGGRWFERGEDSSTCQWGSVLAWEPPARLLLSWDINADWQYDPALNTEIEVRFIADGNKRTRVELEHRRLDRYGARRDEMRRIYDTEGDWGKLLGGVCRRRRKLERRLIRCQTSNKVEGRCCEECWKERGRLLYPIVGLHLITAASSSHCVSCLTR